MQPVGQFHQNNANIAGHRQKHLAEILGLGLSASGEMNPTQFRYPFDQLTDLRTEILFQLIGRDIGVLHNIVKKTCGDHTGAGANVPQ
ncbi:MAG: Uncharacterised protein [Prochlorococcus marinus str. MIT 9215]|nr:MAG: Uncharacterised protein [Prochlorococcus marinus str. MIT 9215]